MIATDTAFPAARPLAVPWSDPHACALGPPGLRMSPGWDRMASGQLWVPSPRLGCPRHPSESPDADSSRGAVLRQNVQQLGKAFHLVNLLREAAEASSELTDRPFQTCCFAPGGLFARSRRCHGSGVCWIRAAHSCQQPRCAGAGGHTGSAPKPTWAWGALHGPTLLVQPPRAPGDTAVTCRFAFQGSCARSCGTRIWLGTNMRT